MNTLLRLLFLGLLSPALLAQNPVVTLSANTFYRGDAPGSYTISCPVGTSAGVSALTKIADVPLLNPASVQYGIGVTFPWPSASGATPTLTGTLPVSNTVSVMGGIIYNAGVLAGTASCNNAVATLTTTTAFTLTLNGITREEIAPLRDRLTWALKASSVKMPQLSTSEQNTLSPQQAGNVVYNTDQKTLAVHNGTAWQYVATNAPEASQFQNEKAFFNTQLWTVPPGVTRIMAETWGGGQGGDGYRSANGGLYAKGGNAGAYARGFMVVTPGTSLTLTVGGGGVGVLPSYYASPGNGGDTSIQSTTTSIKAGGGYTNGQNTAIAFIYGDSVGFGLEGGSGKRVTISYGQQNSTGYVLLIQCGDGGTAYGAQPGGVGEQFASLNSSSLLYTTGGPGDGSFPGGGGGAGYATGGYGAPGMIVLHW